MCVDVHTHTHTHTHATYTYMDTHQEDSPKKDILAALNSSIQSCMSVRVQKASETLAKILKAGMFVVCVCVCVCARARMQKASEALAIHTHTCTCACACTCEDRY